MPAPFALLASRLLGHSPPPSSVSTSQPLFYSFTDDSVHATDDDRDPLADDVDDPHLLRASHSSQPAPYIVDDDIDPFASPEHAPLIPSEQLPPPPRTGWRNYRQPSPVPSAASASSSTSSRSVEQPPDDFFATPTRPTGRPDLRESLLPRDGVAHPVFSLPDPGRVPLRKYNDAPWTVLYCTSLTACTIGAIIVLFATHRDPQPRAPLPYSTLLHTIPLLCILTAATALASYAHVLLLRAAVMPVVLATAGFIPCALAFAAFYSFTGSFIWDGTDGTWGETIGLRIFSLLPLIFAVLAARSLLARRAQIAQTIRVVELATSILLAHPPLLLLSPALLLAGATLAAPPAVLLLRLLLVGYFGAGAGGGAVEWHVRAYAAWLMLGAALVWAWTWCIARGVLRVSGAAVVAAWYFRRTDVDPPDPVVTTSAALYRATGPSFGTVCVASLILTATQAITIGLSFVRRATSPPALPAVLHPLTLPVSVLANVALSLSTYALVYAGVAGAPFFPAARRARALTSVRRPIAARDYVVLGGLLRGTAACLGLLAAIATYLFVAHRLGRPQHALLAAAVAGAGTGAVAWFSLALVDDIADTLYVCYCIERDAGTQRCAEAFAAFEGAQHVGVPSAAPREPESPDE